MNKVLAILLLAAAVAVQARFIPEIQDAIVRYPEMLRLSGFNVGAMSRDAADGKIIGGTPARPGDFPYQCWLSIATSSGGFFCGCSVISDSWILTAAHCADDATANITVTMGDTSRNTTEDTEVTATATTIIVHEDWRPNIILNDIAVLQIPKVDLSTGNIARVCLAQDSAQLFVGVMATVSGWGRQVDGGSVANDLSYVDVPVISNEECRQNFTIATARNICTSTGGNKGTCNGDSGGPLVTDIGGVRTQIGIVSFGSGVSCTAGPSAFTRITSFIDWIEGKVGTGILCRV